MKFIFVTTAFLLSVLAAVIASVDGADDCALPDGRSRLSKWIGRVKRSTEAQSGGLRCISPRGGVDWTIPSPSPRLPVSH
jgi:hypothetical protein